YTSAGLAYYRHSDHLGSSRLATDTTQHMYSSTAYAPFGEPYDEAGTTDRSFTGKDEDTTSGMYDFLERRYNPTAGRWLSPDPAGLGAVDPTNPQTWNRYAYVMNNPLGLIDLIGEECYAGDGNGGCYNNGSGGGGGLAFSGLWGDPLAVNSFQATQTTQVVGWQIVGINGGTVVIGGCPSDAADCSIDEIPIYSIVSSDPYLGAANNFDFEYPLLGAPPNMSGGGAANNGNPQTPQPTQPQKQQPQPQKRSTLETVCGNWNLINGSWASINFGLWLASVTPAAPAAAPTATVSSTLNAISGLGQFAVCP
ncbi:MAG: RHS repeat-associated core domain-containing protein, partial [Gallionella sp.]